MVYTPQRSGFAQSQYFDQQGTALPGMLANASDINLVDSGFVGGVSPVTGLVAGVGVVQRNSVARSNRPGLNYDVYDLPPVSATAADFAGVVVRNQWMSTSASGDACHFAGDMCNVLSSSRVGGRIWVRLESGSTTPGSPVYWIVRDTAGTGKLIGAFAGGPISGTATPTPGVLTSGTVNVNEVQAISNGGIAISAGGAEAQVVGLNFAGVSSVANIADILQTALTSASVAVTVGVRGNSLVVSTTATGAAATLTFASAPTGDYISAADALGLTAASGGVLVQGAAGESLDTVQLPGARYLDTFAASAGNNMALVEIRQGV